ncbi:MAG TPA: histidine phosphatase family protein [Chloroflexia bacterium]|nr:histidine phosphatase family protein [Chloroflexia bacterium]
MPDLILVKHAMPEIVPGVPGAAWGLSAAGRAQCEPLAAALVPHAPVAVVTSTEPKAAETGSRVAAALRLPCTMAPDLHENDRRGLPFLKQEDLEARIAEFFARPAAVVMGQESADAAHARFAAAVRAAAAPHPHGAVVIVAHGTVISLLVSRAFGLDPLDVWRRLGLPSFVVLSRPNLAMKAIVERLGHVGGSVVEVHSP